MYPVSKTATQNYESIKSMTERAIELYAQSLSLEVIVVEHELRADYCYKVYCAEAEGMWTEQCGGTNIDGCVGAFEIGYQHFDSQLRGIKLGLQEVRDLLNVYQMIEIHNASMHVDAIASVFGVPANEVVPTPEDTQAELNAAIQDIRIYPAA